MYVEVPNGVFLNFLTRLQKEDNDSVRIDLDSFNELKWFIEERTVQRSGLRLQNGQIYAIKNGKRTLIQLTNLQTDFLKEILIGNSSIEELKDMFWRNSQSFQPIYNIVNRINDTLLDSGFSLVNESRRILIYGNANS